MFEQTFLYFQLEIYLFFVTENTQSSVHFICWGFVPLLTICLRSLRGKDINSCPAWSHAPNVSPVYLFVLKHGRV